MTRYEIAKVAVKLIGIAMIANGVATSSMAVMATLMKWGYETSFFHNAIAAGGFAAGLGAGWFVAGFYCWHSADRLAFHMVDDDVTPVTGVGLNEADLLSLGSSVIGLFLLLPALRNLMSAALQFGLGEETFDQWWDTVYSQQTVCAALAEAAFGAWLVLGSRGIATVIARWRTAGVSATTAHEPLASHEPPAPQDPSPAPTVASPPTPEEPAP